MYWLMSLVFFLLILIAVNIPLVFIGAIGSIVIFVNFVPDVGFGDQPSVFRVAISSHYDLDSRLASNYVSPTTVSP